MLLDGSIPAFNSSLPIAVDVMGGDHGLGVQVEGAVLAYKEFGAKTILVGHQQDIQSKLKSLGAESFPIGICDAKQVISMEDSPVKAIRRKPDASLCVAYRLTQEGETCAVLSSGNSGAMMAAGRMICGLMPGIERPAIATLIPVAGNGRPNVILDAGANVQCDAHNLVQFAVMGAIYYSTLFSSDFPKVALLSNGTESSKGTDIVRAASAMLSEMESINYVGFVEGRDVTTENADIIICDGFVGNVLLKSMEGCVRLLFDQIMYEGRQGLLRRLSLWMFRDILKQVFLHRFDYTAHGGAPLLGLTKLAIVMHGSSDCRAVKNAIRLADSFVAHKMTEKITTALNQLDENMPDIDSDILSSMFEKSKTLSVVHAKQKKEVSEVKQSSGNKFFSKLTRKGKKQESERLDAQDALEQAGTASDKIEM